MAWMARICLAVAAWSSAAGASDLALKRVVLSTGGLGLYEYEAQVDGDATLELRAPRSQVDDILKSLVVFDDHGGVGGLDTALDEPLTRAFDALPFDRDALSSAPGLLAALQGAEIEVGGPVKIAGRVVGVSEETATGANANVALTQHRVTAMGVEGLRQFVLEDAESVKFADPALRAQISEALAKVAAGGVKDVRVLRLAARGKGARALHVAYLASAPVWKTSYRLLLDPAPDAKKGVLQAWATLENLSGQDWKDVDLTLVSGRPVAFRQELYRAYMVERPLAPVDLGERLAPETDRGFVLREAETAKPALQKQARARRADMPSALGTMAAPSAPRPTPATDALSLAEGAEAIAAQESVTQVAFHLPFPVTLNDGRSLSMPIVDGDAKLRRVALYDPRLDRRHPLSAVEFVNDRDISLPPGIVTIYEMGVNGATYLGDARLSATPAGEMRLMSFALDQKTTVEEDDSATVTTARARIAQGLLTLDDVTRRRAAYRVKTDAPRRLIVLTDKLAGGHLVEPKGVSVEEADGRLRLGFDVPAGEGQTLAILQEMTQTRAVALAGIDGAALATYARSGGLDAETRVRLEKLGALRARQAEAERAFSQTGARIDQVIADQTRLKNLVVAVGTGSDLQKRYVTGLDADETELARLRVEQAAREKTRDAARQAVEDFVAAP